MDDFLKLRDKFDKTIIPNEVLETLVEVREINAEKLLKAARLDIISKIIYVDSFVKRRNSAFALEQYLAHISSFSLGKFIEPGQESLKNSEESYTNVFNELIENISDTKFKSSIVPVANGSIIIDGSHRVAICFYFKIPITIGEFKLRATSYDYQFFKSRFLEEVFLDFMVRKFIEYKADNIYTACLWPSAFTKNKQVKNILVQNSELVYAKEINLNEKGAHLFLSEIYCHDSWVGSPSDKFKGVYAKLAPCFMDFSNPMLLYTIDINKNECILKLKESIRELFSLGKHSIHITDNIWQSKQIGEYLLNSNSLYFLNHGDHFKFKKTREKLDAFKSYLNRNNIPLSEVIVDSSMVLELFGIREAKDIDFIFEGSTIDEGFFSQRKVVDLELLYPDIDFDDPRNYFFYYEIKFLTLEVVRFGKINRNESKDKGDIGLIDSFLNISGKKLSLKDEELIHIKRKITYLYFQLKSKAYHLVKSLGLLKPLKNVLIMLRIKKS